MNTETLSQAIQFAVTVPEVQKHIQSLEALPHRFKIHQLIASVTSHEENTIRVILNFSEKANPNEYNEDALIDIQGTSPADFKVLHIIPYELRP